MKTSIITLISAFLISVSGFSQVNFTGYLVDNNDAKLRDVTVNLFKGNDKVSSKKWSKKFEYDLELESYYTLELVKPQLTVKRIAISTFQGDKGAEPFMFVMEMMPTKYIDPDAENDYPSALIESKKDEGTFNFDVQYAKNIKKQKKEAAKKKRSQKY